MVAAGDAVAARLGAAALDVLEPLEHAATNKPAEAAPTTVIV
jgi:hypothetical protein